MTLFELRKKLLSDYAGVLKSEIDPREIKNDVDSLLEARFGFDFTSLTLNYNMEVSREEVACLEEYLARIAKGEPVQYVTGTAPFLGRIFWVNESVLIPRLDTETLFLEAKKRIDNISHGGPIHILDLCTGSGILGISLKLEYPDACVFASDISEAALEVARDNASRLGAKVSFLQSDLFASFSDNDRFHIIVCNPPYIAEDELFEIPEAVLDYEPEIALMGGPEGLDFYGVICDAAVKHMFDGAWLCFEIGDKQGEKVKIIMENKGFSRVSVTKDIAGMDRVVCGKI